MDNTLYIGLAAQSALKRQMDVLAHNVANLNTTAFNQEKVLFKEYLMEIGGEGLSTGGKISTVLDYKSYRKLERGSFTPTGNPLDIAIGGSGYISVKSNDDTVYYTRNGRLTLNDEGMLTNLKGFPVMNDANMPIIINPDDMGIKISEDGVVSSNVRQIGKIGVFSFDDEQAMNRIGDSLYSTAQPVNIATDYKILQGSIEKSNVNAVMAMSEMIKISRGYESLSRSLSKLQDMRKDSLNRLARVQ